MTLSSSETGTAARSSTDLYRAVWRWHFYAGLLVLPFMITLAVTGALYLFRDELDAILHADLKKVEIQQGVESVAPSEMVAAAVAAHPGTAVKYTDPPRADLSAEITINTDGGERLAVYVDPYSGEVLGSLADRGTVMWTVRYLHSLRYFGPVARGVIEIAGGWAILLVDTGIYLWWPRRQGRGGVLTVRGRPGNRMFWRDTHAVTGILVGFFIVFLAITGMPWSNVWGGKVNEWANGNNFGYPAGVRVAVPMSDEHLHHLGQTSWSLEQARVPESSPAPDAGAGISIDQAVATFDRLGLHRGYAVNIPATPTGVFTGSVYPDDLAQQRVVHLDRYNGEPLIDMSYADYGPLGKWLEFGINVHMGQQFGVANQLFLLVVCAAIVLMSVAAGIMWWKRRPAGSLGVPPEPSDPRVFRGLLAILFVGGVIFPLVGASLIVMLLIDWLIIRRIRRDGHSTARA
jgi:uncharacterized iron-regulated membrane protein